MMKLFRTLIGLAVLSAPSGVWAQKVKVGYDRDTNFSQFKTYSWVKLGIPAANPNVDQWIVSAIEKQLEAKGLTKAEASGNLLLTYESQINATDSFADYGFTYGAGWQRDWWALGGTPPPVETVIMGQVGVALIEASSKHFVWRARATEPLKPDLAHQPDKLEKTINKTVEKMFKDFPPRKK
jgi:hypothetical protein